VANRRRILAAAAAAFDADGVGVSLDEIARRAGVGPGTVHRHFPTKAALVDATLADQVAGLAAAAAGRTGDPTADLLAVLLLLAERGAASHALADRLREAAGDVDAAVAGPLADLRAALAGLLREAQAAGGIRGDLTPGRLDAVIAAAHVLQTHPHGGPDLVRLLTDGLRA
jgi:AcrR family transcriptional regulator